MTRITITPIRPRKNPFDFRDYEREIREAVEDTGDAIVKAFEEIVADWDHDVQFKKRVTVKADSISVDVYPAGPNAMIFVWVDKGTRPHLIEARGKRPLAFQAGYATHTTPGGRYGGPGKKFGEWIHTWAVEHPGTAARNFTGRVLEANKRVFRDAMREAIREARR